jgi:hypothetical protein
MIQKQLISTNLPDRVKCFLLLAKIIYAFGLIYFVSRFFYSIFQLYRKLRSAKKDVWSGIKVQVLLGKGGPFCLGRKIYVYEETKKDSPVLLKLVHEKVHAQNLHTVDIWTFQLVAIINWFNPLVWMLSRDTRFLLECIADQQTIKTTRQKYAYLSALSEKETMEQHPIYAPFGGITQTSRLLFLLNNPDKRIRKFLLIILTAFFILLEGALKQQLYNKGTLFDWNNLYIKKELPCSGNLVDQSKHMVEYKIIPSIPIGLSKSVNNIFERIIINGKLAKGYVKLYIKIEPDRFHNQVCVSFSSNKSCGQEAINLTLERIKRESEWINIHNIASILYCKEANMIK